MATKQEILNLLAAGDIDVAEATQLLQATEKQAGSLTAKVSEKGGVSVYGLQRMPVTLYVEQWERLLAFADDLRAFLKANDKRLTRKADKPKAA